VSATPESHPDYEARIGAYDRLLAVVDTINQQKGDSEQITEVNAILALIDKLPDVRQGRARDTCPANADMRIRGLPYRASRPSILIVALSSKECCRSMSPSVIELPMSDCLYYSLIFLFILRCVCSLSCFATQHSLSHNLTCVWQMNISNNRSVFKGKINIEHILVREGERTFPYSLCSLCSCLSSSPRPL